jgi:acetyl esterase/lipase
MRMQWRARSARVRARGCAQLVLACAGSGWAMSADAEVTFEQVAEQKVAARGERIEYAAESPHQFGVLRVPSGDGPHPVAAIVHGGCWSAAYDYRHVERMAEVLTQRGLATWVIEYRRVGHEGGGWPGTFRDVARGLDHLRLLAPERRLDLESVIVVGHSAGGQLALWLAARAKLAAASELYVDDPLPVAGVVGLAAVADLRLFALGSGSCNAVVPELMGGLARSVRARYDEASPLELVPLRVPVRLVHGAADAIVPLEQSRRFAAAERRANGDVAVDVIARAGHFDVVAPFAPAWVAVEKRVLELAADGARAQR